MHSIITFDLNMG